MEPATSPLKKQMFDAMFGGEGSLSRAEFNRAFKALITQMLRFEKKLLDNNTTASAELKRLFADFTRHLATKTDSDKIAFVRDMEALISDTSASRDLADLKILLANFKLPKDGEDGKDGSPDTGEEIIKKINADKGSPVIRKEKIEGFTQFEATMRDRNNSFLRRHTGVSEFTHLTDAPSSYSGQSGKAVVVKSTEDGLEFGVASGGFSILAATGTVNDSNTTFTFASEPTMVVVNGAIYIDGGGVEITTTTAVLDNPVGTGGKIFGIA